LRKGGNGGRAQFCVSGDSSSPENNQSPLFLRGREEVWKFCHGPRRPSKKKGQREGKEGEGNAGLERTKPGSFTLFGGKKPKVRGIFRDLEQKTPTD